MTSFFSLLHLLGVFVLVYISTSVPTPTRPLGLVYDPESFEAPVHFDFYIDQLCPDSRRAWPTVLQIAKHYGPKKVKLTTHLFPLPYHRNGLRASVSTHVLASINSSLVYPWIQKVYDNIGDLGNSVNSNKSDVEMYRKFLQLAVELGVDKLRFESGFSNISATMETVVGWKYACTRRVAETPTFFVNDVAVGFTEASFWTLADWRNIIDPLVGDAPLPTNTPSISTTTESSSGATFFPGILSLVVVSVSHSLITVNI